jgi:hypothetical protein
MEAVRDFIACGDEVRGPAPARQPCVDGAAQVDGALAALQAVSATAVEDAGSWGFRAASDFAGRVEEISRTVEYLQLVAASAVDRSRKQSAAAGVAASAVTSWTTGWREGPGGWETGGSGDTEPAGTAAAAASAGATPRQITAATGASAGSAVPAGEARAGADDGYRTTVEFLRAGCSSAPRRRGAGSPSPGACCPGRASPASRYRRRTRSSVPPSRPVRSRPGQRASSPSRWSGSGPSAARRPRPGWNTP